MKRLLACLLSLFLVLSCGALAEEAPERESAIFVEAGYAHSFALDADGTLWAWGAGEYGRLGTGSSYSAYSPEEVELDDVVEASAGWYHSLFRTADGGVYARAAITTTASSATAPALTAACLYTSWTTACRCWPAATFPPP